MSDARTVTVQAKMTIDEALAELLRRDCRFQRLGTNCCVIGANDDYIRASLGKSYEVQTYDRLVLEWYVSQSRRDQFRINLNNAEFRPLEDYPPMTPFKPQLPKGGHWWAYDGKFYGWSPVCSAFCEELKDIVSFCGLSKYLITRKRKNAHSNGE